LFAKKGTLDRITKKRQVTNILCYSAFVYIVGYEYVLVVIL